MNNVIRDHISPCSTRCPSECLWLRWSAGSTSGRCHVYLAVGQCGEYFLLRDTGVKACRSIRDKGMEATRRAPGNSLLDLEGVESQGPVRELGVTIAAHRHDAFQRKPRCKGQRHPNVGRHRPGEVEEDGLVWASPKDAHANFSRGQDGQGADVVCADANLAVPTNSAACTISVASMRIGALPIRTSVPMLSTQP